MTFEQLSARALEAMASGNADELAAIATELEATGYTQAAHALKSAAVKLGAKPAEESNRRTAKDTEPPAEEESEGLTEKEKQTINRALDWLEGFGAKVKTGENIARDLVTSDQINEMGGEIGRAAKLAARLLLDPKGTMSDLRREREAASSPKELPPKPPFRAYPSK